MDSEVATFAPAAGEIDAAARALAARWRGGNPADPALRRACTGTLAELRATYRQNPTAFTPSTVRLLRDLAGALAATQVQSTLDLPAARRASDGPAPADVLRDVFGYESLPGRAAGDHRRPSWPAGTAWASCRPGAGKSLTYQIPARILGGTHAGRVAPHRAHEGPGRRDDRGRAARDLPQRRSLAPDERQRRDLQALCRRRVRALSTPRPKGWRRRVGPRAVARLRPAPHRRGRGPLHQPVGARLPPRLPVAARRHRSKPRPARRCWR